MSAECEYHPAANIFPVMSDDALRMLADDIEQNGQREPIELYKGKILDGRNRQLACKLLGREVEACELEHVDDPCEYVLSRNLHRRQLKTSQRAMCAAKLAGLPRGRPSKKSSNEGNTHADAALIFNIGHASLERALIVLHDGCDALIRLCELGDLPVSTACKFMEMATKPIEKKVAKQGAKAVREYIKAQQQAVYDEGPTSEESSFRQFKILWDAADDMGRAAIRAFVIGDEP